jgi:hypothetical protein
LNARNCWQDHLGQGAAMVQDAPITPQALLAEITPSAPAFSLTRVIGGKLCARYDETSELYPERMTELLRALDAEIFGNETVNPSKDNQLGSGSGGSNRAESKSCSIGFYRLRPNRELAEKGQTHRDGVSSFRNSLALYDAGRSVRGFQIIEQSSRHPPAARFR